MSPRKLAFASALLTAISGLALAQNTHPDLFAKPPAATTQATKPSTSQQGTAGAPAPAAQVVLDQTKMALVDELATSSSSVTGNFVKGRLSDVARVSDSRLSEQVVFNGQVTFEPSDQGTQARVNWTSVARTDTGARKLLDSPLKSQFSTTAPKVDAGQQLTAQGDVSGAIMAAKSLFDAQQQQAKPKEQKSDKADQTSTGQDTSQSGVQNSGRPSSASSGAPSNDLLKSAGAGTTTTKTVTAAAADVMGTTTDGCTPRVDTAQGVVIVQSAMTTNGAKSGSCSDTEIRYPIQKSYESCTDYVDAANKKAYPQYKLFYVNGDGGSTYISSSCEKDTDLAYTLSEDTSACTIETDLTNLQAYVRAETIYTNRNNQRVVVATCHRVDSQTAAAIVMTKSEDGCTPRHDFAAGVSYQRKKTTYAYNNQVVTAQDCTETGVTYAHVKVAGVCSDLVDQSSGKAWPQNKITITDASGVTTTIAECAPDSSRTADLVKTTSGCEGQFSHDLAGSMSYGYSRYYYTSFTNGNPVYVTGCAADTTMAYAHQSRINGYQNNDTTRTSKPKTEIYINTPQGEVLVSVAAVRDGAVDIPYSYVGQQTVATGNSSYQGCDAYRETALSDVYTRPDTTEYDYALGPGTPTGPVSVCVDTVVDSRQMESGLKSYVQLAGSGQCGSYHSGPCSAFSGGICSSYPTAFFPAFNRMNWQATINKYNKKNVETGLVISTYCGFASDVWKGTTTNTGQYCGSYTYNGNNDNGSGAVPTSLPQVGQTPETSGETTGSVDYQRLGSGSTLTTCPF